MLGESPPLPLGDRFGRLKRFFYTLVRRRGAWDAYI